MIKKKAPKKIGNVTLKKANYHKNDERYIIMNDGKQHLDGKPFFKTEAQEIAKALRKVKAKRKQRAKLSGEYHKDIKSHNTKINVFSGLTKINGQPNKAKFYIEYKKAGHNVIEYFEKLPKDKYKGSDRIIYVMRWTDTGTALIPLKNFKSNLIVKK
jgi:hypothetical protein